MILECKPISIFEELSGVFADVSNKHGNAPLSVEKKRIRQFIQMHAFSTSLWICGMKEIASQGSNKNYNGQNGIVAIQLNAFDISEFNLRLKAFDIIPANFLFISFGILLLN